VKLKLARHRRNVHLNEVDEDVTLARCVTPSPVCELELRDPPVGDQVVAAGGATCPEGERLDPLARIENVRERKENHHGMKGHVDLAGHVLDEQRVSQQIVRDRLTCQEVRDLMSRLLVQLGLDRGDRLGETRFASEGSKRI
jgi:hypothetical protein